MRIHLCYFALCSRYQWMWNSQCMSCQRNMQRHRRKLPVYMWCWFHWRWLWKLYRYVRFTVCSEATHNSSYKDTILQLKIYIADTEYSIFWQDIDECARNEDLCNQLCNNTDGSYVCECYTGYELQDLFTCIGKRLHYHTTLLCQ